MSKERLQIKIILQVIIAIICIVASFFVGTKNYVNLILLGIGAIWILAIVLNIIQWTKIKDQK